MPGIVCTALRRAEHSAALVLRLLETAGHSGEATLRLGPGIRRVTEVNFLEHPLSTPQPHAEKGVTLTFRPWEIKTLLLEGD